MEGKSEMIQETFVASTPKGAYEQAVEKYGKEIKLLSAKQTAYDNGELMCEVQIAIPEEIFLQRTLVHTEEYDVNEESDSKEDSDESLALMDEIAQLRSQLALMKESLQSDIAKDDDVIVEVKKLLMKKGISDVWLDEVMKGVAGTPLANENKVLVSYCIEEIDEALEEKAENLTTPKVMMLVGSTGTGKTTTIAKLAARYAYLMERPYKVALVNLDSYKVGAIEQLGHYADIMQITHIPVANVADFKEAFESLDGYDVILVDTAGMSPYDTQKFIRTVEYLNVQTPRELEVHLVLPATVKYEDMEDIYQNFSFLNLDALILTKFDETRHLGTLMNFMLTYKMPMSYFSIGQEVPDDLLVASKEYLLERFIGDVNEG